MANRVAISLLRHGLTAENERKAYIGWTNSPLSENGRKMLRSRNQIEKVYASDLKRCIETAQILYPNNQITILKELRELNFGDWETKTYDDLKDVTAYRKWLDAPFHSSLPNGESFQNFSLRVLQGWQKVSKDILEANVKHAVVVTHGGVIRCLLSNLTSINRSYFDWDIPYGGGYQLIWPDEAFRRGEKCTSLQVVPITENQRG